MGSAPYIASTPPPPPPSVPDMGKPLAARKKKTTQPGMGIRSTFLNGSRGTASTTRPPPGPPPSTGKSLLGQ